MYVPQGRKGIFLILTIWESDLWRVEKYKMERKLSIGTLPATTRIVADFPLPQNSPSSSV